MSLMSYLNQIDWSVFIGFTCIFFGGIAFLSGQSNARLWRPICYLPFFVLMLVFGNRFLTYALFDGIFITLWGAIIDFIILYAIALFSYKLNKAHKMVQQYPWLYKRSGLLSWSEINKK